MTVSASAAELLNSAAEATLKDGSFTVRVDGGETVYVKLYDTKPPGLYIGNVLYRVLPSRPVTFWSEDTAYCAVYNMYGGTRELMRLYVSGETFTLLADDSVKLFRWDKMQPKEAVAALR